MHALRCVQSGRRARDDDDAMRPSALRLVQQTTRRLQQQQQRWPVLTLFSKAQNCSLCDDAKAAIERVRQRPDAPRFELHVYDISRRAQDDDPDWEARLAWRRLYQCKCPACCTPQHVSLTEHAACAKTTSRCCTSRRAKSTTASLDVTDGTADV